MMGFGAVVYAPVNWWFFTLLNPWYTNVMYPKIFPILRNPAIYTHWRKVILGVLT